MTLRMPGVAYLGPPDGNWSDGETRPPRGMVVHIAEGSYQGTIGWQRNPASRVSSYFVVDYDGTIAQMLDLDLMAWTQANGNPAWVGVENAGFHTGALTVAQQQANARIFAWLRSVWPSIPNQVTNSPSVGGLGWHGMGGAAWGSHPDCPGPANVALLPTILAMANGAGPTPGPPIPTPRKVGNVFRMINLAGKQFIIQENGLSPTGWSFVTYGEAVQPQIRVLDAAGIGTADARTNQFGDASWQPEAFGPSTADVRTAFINDLAAKVVASLPTGGPGGPTLAQITAAMRAELDRTVLDSVPGQLGVEA